MSFAKDIHKIWQVADPAGGHIAGGKLDLAYDALAPKTPPAAPVPPNSNDAQNAAQQTADQMRARRGMLANIYAGATNSQPVTGKTSLGT